LKDTLHKKYINTAFIIAIIILISINVLVIVFTYSNIRDEELSMSSMETIKTCGTLEKELNEAASNRRGYLLTRDSSFIPLFVRNNIIADSVFKNLNELVKDNEQQKILLDSLGGLIRAKNQDMSEAIELAQINKLSTKSEIEYTQLSKSYDEIIKDVISKIEEIETTQLKNRIKDADAGRKFLLTNVYIGSIATIVLLVISVILLNRRINERNKYSNELEESRNWFSTTLSSIHDAVIVTDKSGAVSFLNPTAEKILGMNLNEASGEHIESIVKFYEEETLNEFENPFTLVIKNLKSIEYPYNTVLKNTMGNYISIDMNASPIRNNELMLVGVVIIIEDSTQRRKSQKELLDSKKFIQKIADSIPNILYVYDMRYPKLTYANYKVAQMLGYSQKDIAKIGTEFFEKYIVAEDLNRLKSLYNRFANAKDDEVIEYEYRIINSKNEVRIFRSFDVVFARDENGIAVEMLGSAVDVTEKKKLEEELKKYSGHLEELVGIRTRELRTTNEILRSEINERIIAQKNIIDAEGKFRDLVENALVGIYIIQNNKYAYVNPKYREIFGYDESEILGMDAWKTIHDDYKQIVQENIDKRLSGEIKDIQYSFKAVRRDGKVIDVEVRGTKMEYKGDEALIGTLLDITERNKSEQELNEQREFLRLVIDLNPNLIFAKDWDGKFTLVNKSVADIYGTSVAELVGKSDADFNSNTEEVEHFINDDREVMKSKQMKFIPEEQVTNSGTGETRWFKTIKVPIEKNDGSLQVLGVASDITARKLADELTKKSLAQKEILLQEIHHRVKNNLQIIISLLKLQSQYIKDYHDLEIFQNSRSRVETMSLIHEKLYRSADINNIDLNSYISDIANRVVMSAEAYREIKVEVNSEDDTKLTIDTAIPCGLVINELMINILKYSKHLNGIGVIKIDIRKIDGKFVIDIFDNGTGIREMLDVSNSESLGLQLVETLLMQLDGSIEIDRTNYNHFKISFEEIVYKDRIKE